MVETVRTLTNLYRLGWDERNGAISPTSSTMRTSRDISIPRRSFARSL